MNRRSFLGSILAAAAAPAIVRADSLMRIVPRDVAVLPPELPAFEIGYYETMRFIESFPGGIILAEKNIQKTARSLTIELVRAAVERA